MQKNVRVIPFRDDGVLLYNEDLSAVRGLVRQWFVWPDGEDRTSAVQVTACSAREAATAWTRTPCGQRFDRLLRRGEAVRVRVAEQGDPWHERYVQICADLRPVFEAREVV